MYDRRYRRALPMAYGSEPSPRLSGVRIVVGLVSILILWKLAQSVLGFFGMSALASGSGILEIEARASNVQVSVEDGELQRAESGLKLYPGDTVATHTNGRARISFFDGTNVRLKDGSQLTVTEAVKSDHGAQLTFELTQGELWMKTQYHGSGSAVRTIDTPYYDVSIDGDSELILSTERIVVLKSEGLGIALHLKIDAPNNDIVIGEGQVFSLDTLARTAMEKGAEPYAFRDPITALIEKEEFIEGSQLLAMNTAKERTKQSSSGSTVATLDDITILSPKEGELLSGRSIHITGKTGKSIAKVTVNGHSVTVSQTGNFGADVAVERQGTTVLRIEGFTEQGLKASEVVRTVEAKFEPFAETVTFVSPVGSGQVFTTTIPEVQLTGLAPAAAAGIVVNNYKLQLFKPGAKTWSYIATTDFGNFSLGENTFTAYAIDEFGNRSAPVSIKVTYAPEAASSSGSTAPIRQNTPKEPGSLKVTSPTENATNDRELRIDGTTSKQTASITVNGYTLQYYEPGSTLWSYIASIKIGTMHRGRNVYRIESRDVNGDVLDVLEYTLIFRP